ncbi:hypothetical protein DITRI_Ditri08aG0130100 [Diplodiscus trichospermus]
MEDDKLRTRIKVKRRYAAATMAGSLVTMALLIWTITCGFHLTMEPWRYTAVAARTFHIGVTTMVFGFLFLTIGLAILADLFFNISEQLPELSVMNQGRETRTIPRVAKALVTSITMFVIMWGMYTGFMLATESGENKHHLLTVSIGVNTILFGLIYFIIGLANILELVLEFWTRPQ